MRCTATFPHRHTAEAGLTVHTREEALARLTEMGFTFSPEGAEWVNGDIRGRLSHFPDYCNDNGTSGTSFWLTRPFNAGIVHIIGSAR